MTKARNTKAKTVTVTLAEQRQAAATLAVAYLAGQSDTAPAIATPADVLAIGALAFRHSEDMATRASAVAGGAQGLAVAVAITLAYTVKEASGGKTYQNAVAYMKDNGYYFGASDASVRNKTKRLAMGLHFNPTATHSAPLVFAEVMASVRAALAKHGTIKAWYDASPALQSAKGARPEGNDTATETDAEPAAPMAGRPKKENGATAPLDIAGQIEALLGKLETAAETSPDALNLLAKVTATATNALERCLALQEAATAKPKRTRKAA